MLVTAHFLFLTLKSQWALQWSWVPKAGWAPSGVWTSNLSVQIQFKHTGHLPGLWEPTSLRGSWCPASFLTESLWTRSHNIKDLSLLLLPLVKTIVFHETSLMSLRKVIYFKIVHIFILLHFSIKQFLILAKSQKLLTFTKLKIFLNSHYSKLKLFTLENTGVI